MDTQPWVGGAGCGACSSRSGSSSLGTRRNLRRPLHGESVMFAPGLGGRGVGAVWVWTEKETGCCC